jgi:uncharacterized conserved membrane protein, sapB/mtgC family
MAQDILSFMPDYLNYFVRIILAAACGFVIGFERKTRSKEAGIRTHTIVALGSCLIMVISKYAFWDESGKYDGARIAAQIVSGIGFLGAGMIVYSKGTLHGLTTAAGIWATAGVGMAIGAGGNVMLIVGCASTVLIVLVHLFLHLPIKLFASKTRHQIQIQFKVTDDSIDRIKEIFKAENIFRLRMQCVDGQKIGTALLRTSDIPGDNSWKKIMDENDFITAMEYFEDEW